MLSLKFLLRYASLIFAVLSIWELILGLHGGLLNISGIKVRQMLLLVNFILFFANRIFFVDKLVFRIDKRIQASMLIIFLIGIFWTCYGIIIYNNKFAITEGISYISIIHIFLIFSALARFEISEKKIFLIFQLPMLILFSSISLTWTYASILNVDISWIFEMFNDPDGQLVILSSENSSGRFFFQNTVLLICSVFIFSITSRKMKTFTYYSYLVLYMISIFAIGSRAVALGAILIISYSFLARNIGYLNSKRYVKILFALSIFIGIILIFFSYSTDLVSGSRFFDVSSSSISNSDDIRFEQANYLIREFQRNPIFGSGLGHYASDYIRSNTNPYAYELFLYALLMKIGLVGIILFFYSLFLIFVPIFNKKSFSPYEKRAYLLTMLSILFMSSTNPILITPVGFLLLFLPWFYLELKHQNLINNPKNF